MIPGVVWHDREAWQSPTMPVTGPGYIPTAIDTVAIHYTAAANLPDGDLGEFAYNIPPYLRAIQRDYVTTRVPSYSIGYNVAIDWLGGVWELRGFDYRCAANAGHNEHTFAILVLVDGADPATPEAAAAIRAVVAEVHRRANRIVGIQGHRELSGARTACPGGGLLAQIHAGVFDPTTPAPAPPPPIETPTPPPAQPTTEELPVNFILKSASGAHALYQLEGGESSMTGVSPATAATMASTLELKTIAVSDAEFSDFTAKALVSMGWWAPPLKPFGSPLA